MILALDLATKCGYAIGRPNAVISGVWDFKQGRFAGGGMRYVEFERKLDEVHAAGAITEVAFEEVRFHNAVDAAHVHGGLLAILTAWCEKRGIPYKGVPVGTIKKFWTGSGNASKERMVEAARLYGYEPQDHNEADALAVLHYRLTEIGA